MVINQGDIFWVEVDEPTGSEPGYTHPHVIVQNNLYNQSKIRTVIVCVLTSNIKYADVPGNVKLEKGEANLPKASVVNVSQILTIDKSQLGEYIGTVASRRVDEILDGISLLLEPRVLDRL